MKDYPDERIAILNKAFFHKKTHISFKFLDFKRKVRNYLYVSSSNRLQHITKLINPSLGEDRMKYLDAFLQDETPISRVYTMS